MKYNVPFPKSISLVPPALIAGVLSYSINQSLAWCLLHMCCGWFYVLYWICQYSRLPEFIAHQWVI